MHRHNGPRTRRDSGCYGLRVNQQILRIDVNGHRDGSDPARRLRCGDKSIGRKDDLVAGRNTRRPQRQFQRVSPVGHANAVAGTQEFGICRLELGDGRPTDESRLAEDLREALHDLRIHVGLLRHQVHQGDGSVRPYRHPRAHRPPPKQKVSRSISWAGTPTQVSPSGTLLSTAAPIPTVA